MTDDIIVTGTVLGGDPALTLEELANACGMEVQWVVSLVQEGILSTQGGDCAAWRFQSVDLCRVRQVVRLQRTFDASVGAAAVMVELLEELGRLRGRLRQAGLEEF